MATIIRVALDERSYDIEIGRGQLARCAEFIGNRQKCVHAVIIADGNVGHYAHRANDSLQAAGIRSDLLTVPPGEGSKSLVQAERLWTELIQRKTDRQTVVVAIGGGVVGDLAGFVAATYARGLPFVQIPTTLLAQVDSSVGGKVGVNLPQAKNIIGAFWQPAGVLIDLDVLTTLPDREYRSGLAEVVKYGVILDADFVDYLEQHAGQLITREPDALEYIVAHSCRLKARVVEHDEREQSGGRAVLNYGHTFAHAIETVTGYGQYLHGEAVAIGMVAAARLAELLGRVDAAFTARQRALLNRLDLPTTAEDLNADQLLAAMQHDKKVEHGKLKFVLPTRLGAVELVCNVPPQLVRQSLFALRKIGT